MHSALTIFNCLLFFVFASSEVESISVYEVKSLISTLDKVLRFMNEYYDQINFDGLLGVVFAESM